MPLVTLNSILSYSDSKNYGIGAFNILSMKTVMGAIKAGEELNAPIIIQVAEGRLKYCPLNLIGPLMVTAAKEAKIPVTVHLDHGSSIEVIEQALKLGFSSVMFDGSRFPLEENIALTNKVRAMAKPYGASVEAEIGKVGGSEGDYANVDVMITSVEEAKHFYEETGVDALAVAIGTVHGNYKELPDLQFERLTKISEVVPCPLVLHGGSGLTSNDFRMCINNKMKKINIATASFQNIVEKVTGLVNTANKCTYFQYHDAVLEGMYENVKKHILIFGSNNKA